MLWQRPREVGVALVAPQAQMPALGFAPVRKP
jgi:hypothetical protein